MAGCVNWCGNRCPAVGTTGGMRRKTREWKMNKSMALVVSLLTIWASVGCSSDLEGPAVDAAEADSDQSASQSFEVTRGSCSPNPCAHGGTCRRVRGGHVCTCTPGWSGANCQTDINECTPVSP